ncbi:hypothetical protein [Lewinella sp. W8]|uniref:hypothetical protein n=1 Tax=Lewinella sp. W8 TaxID=2528208 RepID=UPI001068396F|nr:hypothetical protein [Lewinella sp. W8]MTB53493.1 hypothetical protein [Lewinella sp. W8]
MLYPRYLYLIRLSVYACLLLFTAMLSAQTRPGKIPGTVRSQPLPQATRPGELARPTPPAERTGCCLPTTTARNREALFLEPTGSISADYRLTVDVSGEFANILRAYINYISSISPCANRFVTMWTLTNLSTNEESRQWIFVDKGNPHMHNNPHVFNLPVKVNTPYRMHVYTYFEPKGCDIGRCIDDTSLIDFSILVSPNARQVAPILVLSDAGREISRRPLGNGKTKLFPNNRRQN